MSPDGRYVCKTIRAAGGRQFSERVRLFGAQEIEAMLADLHVTVEHRFGDYDAAPPTPESPRTLLVGRRG